MCVLKIEMFSHPLCALFMTEAIPIPADQPILQIKNLDEVAIPTMEIKVINDQTSQLIFVMSFL